LTPSPSEAAWPRTTRSTVREAKVVAVVVFMPSM
jgi:hypothetical protein